MESTTKELENGKIIWIDLKGFFSVEKTRSEVKIFEENLPYMDAPNKSLVIDCTNLKVFVPEILTLLTKCYELYNEFDKCVMVNPTKTLAKNQLHRVSAEAPFKFNGVFVDTQEEVWKVLKG